MGSVDGGARHLAQRGCDYRVCDRLDRKSPARRQYVARSTAVSGVASTSAFVGPVLVALPEAA